MATLPKLYLSFEVCNLIGWKTIVLLCLHERFIFYNKIFFLCSHQCLQLKEATETMHVEDLKKKILCLPGPFCNRVYRTCSSTSRLSLELMTQCFQELDRRKSLGTAKKVHKSIIFYKAILSTLVDLEHYLGSSQFVTWRVQVKSFIVPESQDTCASPSRARTDGIPYARRSDNVRNLVAITFHLQVKKMIFRSDIHVPIWSGTVNEEQLSKCHRKFLFIYFFVYLLMSPHPLLALSWMMAARAVPSAPHNYFIQF